MNKKQLFKNMWVSIEKRYPPDTNDRILVYEELFNGSYFPEIRGARKARENIYTDFSLGRKPRISHWMSLYLPEES